LREGIKLRDFQGWSFPSIPERSERHERGGTRNDVPTKVSRDAAPTKVFGVLGLRGLEVLGRIHEVDWGWDFEGIGCVLGEDWMVF